MGPKVFKEESFFDKPKKKKKVKDLFFNLPSDSEEELEEEESEESPITSEASEGESEEYSEDEQENPQPRRSSVIIENVQRNLQPVFTQPIRTQTTYNVPSMTSTSSYNIAPITTFNMPSVPAPENKEPIRTVTFNAPIFTQSKAVEVRGVKSGVDTIERAISNIPESVIPLKQTVNVNAPIDSILVKEEYEDDKKFAVRKSLAHRIKDKTGVTSQAAVNLSYVLIRKTFFGVTYNPELEKVIDEIVTKIV